MVVYQNQKRDRDFKTLQAELKRNQTGVAAGAVAVASNSEKRSTGEGEVRQCRTAIGPERRERHGYESKLFGLGGVGGGWWRTWLGRGGLVGCDV